MVSVCKYNNDDDDKDAAADDDNNKWNIFKRRPTVIKIIQHKIQQMVELASKMSLLYANSQNRFLSSVNVHTVFRISLPYWFPGCDSLLLLPP